MASRNAAIIAIPLLLALGLLLWWLTRPVPAPAPAELRLAPASFDDLAGWRDDNIAASLPAFLRSCSDLLALPDTRPLHNTRRFGTVADWRLACTEAASLPSGDDAAARNFFERHFTPVAATAGGDPAGLFTGYYEPLLHGSRTPDAAHSVPLYLRPDDLVTVDLGDFREDLEGRRIAGRVQEGRLLPYPSRAEIEAGALTGRDLELVWVDDPVDAFFLHIQGSGRVQLADGEEMRVGYAGQNGQPYLAIGRELIARGAISREAMSMQAIRQWLAEHPEEAAAVMQLNRSYIFFRELKGDGPVGAQGVALTPGRSLAVDRKLIGYGIPIWLDASAPAADPATPDRPLRRLLVAQDTGGAIRGPVRGDVFWGHGEDAAAIAGRMKHPGRWYLLLPKAVAARQAPGD